MEREHVEIFLTKRILLKLDSGFQYNGKILEFIDDETLLFLDRYNKTIIIKIENINEVFER